jgi:hypothetical protein
MLTFFRQNENIVAVLRSKIPPVTTSSTAWQCEHPGTKFLSPPEHKAARLAEVKYTLELNLSSATEDFSRFFHFSSGDHFQGGFFVKT